MIYHTFMFNIYEHSQNAYFQNQYKELIKKYENDPIYIKLINNIEALRLREIFSDQYKKEVQDHKDIYGDTTKYQMSDKLLKIENKIKQII